MSWRPRSSALGGYMNCDFRAAFDRLIEAGELAAQPQEPSAYADFGTCAHYKLQTSLGCVFPDGNHAPSPEQRAVAAGLHAAGKLDEMIDIVAGCARAAMPISPDGLPWLAETAFKLPFLSGHIDFLSQDHTVIGDLKTTSRKPDHQRVKPEHLWQGICYKIGVRARFKIEPKTLWFLYADSLRGQWAMLVSVDLQSDAMREMEDHVLNYIKYLRSKRLFRDARPRMGMHCSSGFCPHVARCKDRFIPAPTTIIEAPSPVVAASPKVSSFLKPAG